MTTETLMYDFEDDGYGPYTGGTSTTVPIYHS